MPGPSERWSQIERIFAALAALPPAERTAYLDRTCAHVPDLRREVESLLAYDQPAAADLAEILGGAAASFVDGSSLVGRRFGPYLATAVLGTGGMGAVYLGIRADDQFRKHAAIKVVKRGMDTDAVLDRFRRERQILANLDHPYIAKLLDGGATADGLPYFVMEYVQGKPIDEYCAAAGLGIAQRCELFRKVCEAVSYAHRNLVIHGDLKPANILVADDGMPKLLDFGISRVLTPEGAGNTVDPTFLSQPLTPDFASPEQVRGGAVTTATDVYALGAVLYNLLTGVKPHRLGDYSPLEVEQAVCRREPPRPSAVAPEEFRRGLGGDLDAILLAALHKEAARRYQSVDQFGGDIRRHFAGLPVSAREDSSLYVAGRFLRRHRLGAAASVLVAVSLAGGAIAASWEARQADRQRRIAELRRREAETERARAQDEARLAQTQSEAANREHQAAARERDAAVRASGEANVERRRAEERLRNIVGLADVTLLDIHGILERLPGATSARKQMVEATVKYLDTVAKTSGDDPGVGDVLAGAYVRLGDVQGLPNHPSLGDTAGAQASYQKALAVLQRNQALDPQDPRVLAGLIEVRSRLGEIAGLMGKLPEALAQLQAALDAAEMRSRREPAALASWTELCTVNRQVADLLYSVKPEEAAPYARKALAVCQKVAGEHPGDSNLLERLADAHSTLGKTLLTGGTLPAALDEFRQTALIREQLLSRNPDDGLLRRVLMVAYGHIGDLLDSPLVNNLGRPDEAIAYYRKAVAIAESLAQADPRNGLAQYDLASALLRQGMIAPSPAGIADSLKTLRRAAAIEETLRGQDSKNLRHAENLVVLYEYIGTRLADLGDLQGAVASYRQSLELAQAVSVEAPTNSSVRYQILLDYHWLSRLRAAACDRAGAIETAQTAIAAADRFEKESDGAPTMRQYAARCRQWLGEVYRKLAETPGEPVAQRIEDWRAARAAFAGSVERWQKIAAANVPGRLAQELHESQAGLEECDRQLALLPAAPGR